MNFFEKFLIKSIENFLNNIGVNIKKETSGRDFFVHIIVQGFCNFMLNLLIYNFFFLFLIRVLQNQKGFLFINFLKIKKWVIL